MKPQNHPDSVSSLLNELQMLQEVLDGHANEQGTHAPNLDALDDIPLLNELFEEDSAALKNVVTPAAVKPIDVFASVQRITASPKSENPFLPQSVLDRLSHEREAAQQSAAEAHRTMLRITEQKHQGARTALAGIGKDLTKEQKDALVAQMVDEMLPQIADRLREKLRLMLNR